MIMLKTNIKDNENYAARVVYIKGVPETISEAIEVFNGESQLISAAVNYVVAHSLLSKARKLAAAKPDSSEPIEMDFKPAQTRSEAPAVKVDARKMSKVQLEATIAALKAGNIAFKVIGQ